MPRSHCVVAGLLCVAAVSARATPYEDAEPQAKADALSPVTRDYYLKELRPSFSALFQSLLDACASRVSADTQSSFGLVFTVTPQGTVKQVLWKTPNQFTECLEPGLRAAKFPPAPKEEFFFGLSGG